uniref:Uncharacterized protein n=1 Tax=Arundo donax TaxID=35708 RepID=A0A0A9A2Y8_ARUDO
MLKALRCQIRPASKFENKHIGLS